MNPEIKNTNYYFISGMLLFAFVLNFMSEITYGIFRLGVLDEVASLVILSAGVLILFSLKKATIVNMDFIILFTVLSLIYIIFYYNNFLSFIYEYYKLFIFLIFLPILKFFKPDGLQKFLKILFWFFIIVLFVNLIFIVLQYVTSNKILAIIQYNELRVSGWERLGRYTGLFDVATLGSTSLLIMLLNEIGNRDKKSHRVLFVLALISVVFSSSKASYVILILWFIIYHKDVLIKNFLQIFLALSVLITVFVAYTFKAIQAKIVQYGYFFEKIQNPNLINLTDVEKRALFWAESIKIFMSNPFGIGFGTFGDTSAKLNPKPYKMNSRRWEEGYVYMSDSTFSHLLAEQGVTMLLYFLVLIFPLFIGSKRIAWKFSVLLVVFYVVQILFTMGFSSGSWPIIFAFIYALIYYSKKFDTIFDKKHAI
ncbi:O-antigen ligase family protein [Aequorivita sediminis]|uniref:O-antigen ligase family protein n=1 Tax=Aequorivita sediminis TaxID=3073653 RepID=UPI0028A6B8E1|nr:O-antigen ligase family protein [Aequorivita sp. F6058]